MGGRSVGPHTAGQEGKEKATARRFSPLDCLFDLLLSSVSADNLYCSDMGVRGCPYRAMAFYQSYRFKSNLTFSHGVIARPGHPRTDCIFWNGAAFLFRLLSERQGASGCIFCSGASDRRAGTMCLSPSGRYSQKISTGKYAPLDPLEFPVLRLPRRKRLREMDNLSDPLSACDLSTGNRALSFVRLPSFSLSASAI